MDKQQKNIYIYKGAKAPDFLSQKHARRGDSFSWDPHRPLLSHHQTREREREREREGGDAGQAVTEATPATIHDLPRDTTTEKEREIERKSEGAKRGQGWCEPLPVTVATETSDKEGVGCDAGDEVRPKEGWDQIGQG